MPDVSGLIGLTAMRHRARSREIAELKVQLAARDRVVRAAAIFIDRVGLWILAGMTGMKPQPPAVLHEHIDPSLWDQPPAA